MKKTLFFSMMASIGMLVSAHTAMAAISVDCPTFANIPQFFPGKLQLGRHSLFGGAPKGLYYTVKAFKGWVGTPYTWIFSVSDIEASDAWDASAKADALKSEWVSFSSTAEPRTYGETISIEKRIYHIVALCNYYSPSNYSRSPAAVALLVSENDENKALGQ